MHSRVDVCLANATVGLFCKLLLPEGMRLIAFTCILLSNSNANGTELEYSTDC